MDRQYLHGLCETHSILTGNVSQHSTVEDYDGGTRRSLSNQTADFFIEITAY